MDPRLGLEAGMYSLDQPRGAQSLLRSSDGYAAFPPSQLLGSAASGALQPLHNLGGYVDRDLGRPDISSLPHYTPAPMHSLSSGQGYYTVESLEGAPVAAGDVLGGRHSLLMQERDRNAGLGQRGFASSILSSSAENGLGQSLTPSVQAFGAAGETAPYLTSRLPQEVDVGRGGLLRVDASGAPYLPHSQSGLLPGPGPYGEVAPSRLALGAELELRRRKELMVALEQRREVALEQRRELEYEARIREANREALIREAHIREAQLEHAARFREARVAFLQEQNIPERPGRLPLRRDDRPLSRPMRTATAKKTFWCSVCQFDCNTAFNLKSHLGGKRHKLKLEEEAEKKNGGSAGKKETEKVVDADSKPEPTKGEANGAENVETQNGKAQEEIDGVDGVSEAANLKRSLSDDTDTGARKKSKNDESGLDATKSEGSANKVEKSEKPSGPRKVEKCEICNITCIAKGDLENHLKGKKHAGNLKRLQGGVPKVDKDMATQVDPKRSEEGVNS